MIIDFPTELRVLVNQSFPKQSKMVFPVGFANNFNRQRTKMRLLPRPV